MPKPVITEADLEEAAADYVRLHQQAYRMECMDSDVTNWHDKRAKKRARRKLEAEQSQRATEYLQNAVLKKHQGSTAAPWLLLVPWWWIISALVKRILKWLNGKKTLLSGQKLD